MSGKRDLPKGRTKRPAPSRGFDPPPVVGQPRPVLNAPDLVELRKKIKTLQRGGSGNGTRQG